MRFAFISKHNPTEKQHELAAKQNIALIHIGNKDAFAIQPVDIFSHKLGPFDGVVFPHPAAAMRLAMDFRVGVFKNIQRPCPDGELIIEPDRLFVYDHRDRISQILED